MVSSVSPPHPVSCVSLSDSNFPSSWRPFFGFFFYTFFLSWVLLILINFFSPSPFAFGSSPHPLPDCLISGPAPRGAHGSVPLADPFASFSVHPFLAELPFPIAFCSRMCVPLQSEGTPADFILPFGSSLPFQSPPRLAHSIPFLLFFLKRSPRYLSLLLPLPVVLLTAVLYPDGPFLGSSRPSLRSLVLQCVPLFAGQTVKDLPAPPRSRCFRIRRRAAFFHS